MLLVDVLVCKKIMLRSSNVEVPMEWNNARFAMRWLKSRECENVSSVGPSHARDEKEKRREAAGELKNGKLCVFMSSIVQNEESDVKALQLLREVDARMCHAWKRWRRVIAAIPAGSSGRELPHGATPITHGTVYYKAFVFSRTKHSLLGITIIEESQP